MLKEALAENQVLLPNVVTLGKKVKKENNTRSYYPCLTCHQRVLWDLLTVFVGDTQRIASGSFIQQILIIRTSFCL